MINEIIYSEDLQNLSKKQSLSIDEIELLSLGEKCSESKIQTRCHNLCMDLDWKYQQQFGEKVIEFVQIDNGNSFTKNVTQVQRMAFFARKKAEGSKKGFADVMIILKGGKVIFIEFKKIDTPSQIKIGRDQLRYKEWLSKMGFSSYITNNPVFFKNVILKEVMDYLTKLSLTQIHQGKSSHQEVSAKFSLN